MKPKKPTKDEQVALTEYPIPKDADDHYHQPVTYGMVAYWQRQAFIKGLNYKKKKKKVENF